MQTESLMTDINEIVKQLISNNKSNLSRLSYKGNVPYYRLLNDKYTEMNENLKQVLGYQNNLG